MICCGIINSSDYLCAVLEQWNVNDLYRALNDYREWTLGEDPNDGIFGDLIRRNEGLTLRHMTTLGDVLSRDFVSECGQYLGETFGYIQYVQHQQREREENDNILSIQEEFEIAYYHLAECLYSCYQSLPRRLFERLRIEIGRNIDEQLFEAILNMKYTFFLGASKQMRYDLEYMFSLFYAEKMQLIPNCQRIDSRTLKRKGADDYFPLLISLLGVICLDEEEVDAFCASLGLDEETDLDRIAQEALSAMKVKYGVECLQMKQIKQIVDKMAVRQKSKTAGNPTDDIDSSDDDSIDLSDDLGTTRF